MHFIVSCYPESVHVTLFIILKRPIDTQFLWNFSHPHAKSSHSFLVDFLAYKVYKNTKAGTALKTGNQQIYEVRSKWSGHLFI